MTLYVKKTDFDLSELSCSVF